MSVDSFAISWLNTVDGTVKDSTFDHYASLIRTHVLPRIGKQRIQNIQAADLAGLYKDCLSAGSSPATTRHVHKVIRMMFRRAVEWGYILRNPAELVKPPRQVQRQVEIPSARQVKRFIDVTRNSRLHAFWTLACTTGARVSELLALTWSDIDFGDAEIHISRSLIKRDGKFRLDEPKSIKAVRTVCLTNISLEALRNHGEVQNRERSIAGNMWNNAADLVFTNRLGYPIDRGSIYRQFKQFASLSGLPNGMTFHDLRHTAASLLLANGMPIPLVSEMLGHSSPAITLQIYSHAVPNSQHQLAEKMDELLAITFAPDQDSSSASVNSSGGYSPKPSG